MCGRVCVTRASGGRVRETSWKTTATDVVSRSSVMVAGALLTYSVPWRAGGRKRESGTEGGGLKAEGGGLKGSRSRGRVDVAREILTWNV